MSRNPVQEAPPVGAGGGLGERDGLRWWPTLLGLAIAVASGVGEPDGAGLAMVVALAAFIYVAAAAHGDPRAAWIWVAIALPLITLGKLLDAEAVPLVLFLVLAVVLAGWGVARGRWAVPGGLPWQVPAMIVFGVAAVLGFVVGSAAGGLLVAAGLAAHGAWDVLHHRRNRVVGRAYAEFCAALDFLLAGLIAWVVLF